VSRTPEPLLTTQDLADYLKVPVATVYKWRSVGTAPRGVRVGRHVRYRLRDVERWLDKRSDPETQ
jgi:excisionase family DNA binding protein